MTNIGFVIGNGITRKDFDLRQLSHAGTTYGMNAIYRDFFPDNIVSIKRHHLTELLNWNLEGRLYVHTTTPLISLTKNPKLELVPAIPITPAHPNELHDVWKTGSYTILLAAERHDIVVCFGMDFGGENIYQDSDNYWNQPTVDYSSHLQQVLKLVEYYDDTKFIFIQDTDTNATGLDTQSNVSFDTYENTISLLLT